MADEKIAVEAEVVGAETPVPTNNYIQATSTLLSNGGITTEIVNHLEKINQAELEGLACGMVGSILGTAYKLLMGDKLKEETPEVRLIWFNTMIRNAIPFFSNGIAQNNLSVQESSGQTAEDSAK